MFAINEDLSIYLTRGDAVYFTVGAKMNGENYTFHSGDTVRMKVFERKACENVVLEKVFPISVETERVEILLTKEDTKIGEVISKPVDYWYEIELNPASQPQTIIGYDENGPKVFRLYPEGAEADDKPGGGTYDFDIVGEYDADGQFFGWQVYSAIAVNQAIAKLKEELTETFDEKLAKKADKTELENKLTELTETTDTKLAKKADKTDLENLRAEITGELDVISELLGEVT